MKPFRNNFKGLVVLISLVVAPAAFCAAPSIATFSPTSGSPGTTVTISGANFGATSSNDIVYFGPVRATVTAANATNISVTVPNGAMYAPITVTAGGLVAYSPEPFEPTFSGDGAAFDATSFAPRLDIPMPQGPTRIAVVDIDGDGKPDLIIGSIYAHQITILRNVSTSGSLDSNSFAAPVTFPFVNTAESPYWLLAGDVDGDGKIDLIAPDEAGNQVLIYRNISPGGPITTNSFAAPVAFNVGMSPRNIALRDIDGDGRPDLAAANIGDNTVSILKNVGVAGVIDTNSFAPQFVLQAGSQPHDLTFGDLDGDGKPDLAVNNYTSPFVSLFRNVSVTGALDTNSFEARVDLPAPSYCNSIVMGDMDNDGKLDLLIGTAEGNNEVSVFRNISAPGSLTTNSFAPHLDFPAAGWVDTVAVGDLNGDGKLDVLAVNQMNSTVSIFENVGTGSFSSNSLAARVDYVSGSNPYSVSVVDLDGDGRPDVVFNNVYSDSLSIYRNLNGTPTGPVITGQPTNRTVAAGGTVTFSVTAVGTAPLGYQWYGPASNLIVGAVYPTLTLSNVQTSVAGAYFVLVTNLYGFAQSSNATLTVIGSTSNTAPLITKQPTNQTVAVGAGTIFSVTATGSPTLHYQWYGPAGGLIAGAINPTLILSNVQPSAAGAYFVLVTNLYGFAQSSNALLTVNGGSTSNTCTPPPSQIAAWWPAEGNGNDIVGGNTATPQGGATFAPSEVGQAFLLNGTNDYLTVPASSNLNVAAGGSFTAEAWIKVSDLTGYHPIVEWNNNAGNAGPHLWILPYSGETPGVLFANIVDTSGGSHSFHSPGGTVTTNVFQHVALTYDQASGTGTLYLNGNVVAQANFGQFTPQTSYPFWMGHRPNDSLGGYLGGLLDELSLYRRALSQSEIQAIYSAGTNGKCSVVSGTAPVITHQPTNQTVSAGGVASFSVTATGTAPLHYQWYNPSSLVIPGATGTTLTLSNVQPADAGNYFVLVTNLYGFAQSSNAVLTVTGGGGGSNTCTPPPSGLVSWWKGEGNALDSADGNNGTLLNGVGFAPGEVGQGFLFTHTNQNVRIPASSNLDVGLGGGLTLEAWINPSDVTQLNPIFEYNADDGVTYWGVHMYVLPVGTSNSVGALYTDVQSVEDNWHQLQSADAVVSANSLQHVALTYDKTSGVARLYRNGTIVAETTFGSFTPKTTGYLNIGCRPTDPANQSFTFSGVIDEPSVYNRALSSNEIAAIYNAGTSGKCSGVSGTAPVITQQPTNQTVSAGDTASFSVTATGTVPLHYQWYNPSSLVIPGATAPTLTLSNVQPADAGNYFVLVTNLYGFAQSSNAVLTVTGGGGGSNTCTPPPSGLVSWWKGEGNALDSADGNNGTLLNGVGFAPGEVGQGFLFTQTNQNVRIPASPNLDVGLGDGMTLEAWINPSDVSKYNPIFEYNADDGVTYWGVHLYSIPAGSSSNAPLYANVQGVGDNWHQMQSPTPVITVNSLQHVALTYDKASGVARLYRNGTIVAETTFGSFTPKTTGYLNIGCRPTDPANQVLTFSGVIDEPSVYNRALSSNEIAAIYNAGTNGKCSGVSGAAPVITQQPTNRTATVGSTATFSVAATGTQPLSYQWSGPSGTIVGATNSLLILSNVQPSNAGSYHVFVSDAYGSTTSSNASLTVNFGVTAIKVASTSAPGGVSVDVPIIMVANGNENALSFSLNFDPNRLTYSSISLGGGATNGFLLSNVSQAGAGRIGIELALPSGTTFTPGTQELVRVTFTSSILSGSQAVTTVSFTNQPIAKLLSDAQGQALPATFVNGTVTLTPSPLESDAAPRPGGNGSLNVFDWVQIGRFVAGLDTVTNGSEFQKVDCAPRDTLGDGQIKVTDWVQAGRYAAGLDPLTVAGGPSAPVPPFIAKAQPNQPTSRQVTVSGGATVKGMTVTLPVKLEAQGNEIALAFSLNFDPTVLSYVGTVKGSDASSAVLNVNATQAGSGKLAVALCLPIGSYFTAGNKEIANVSFVAVASGTNNTVGFADLPVARCIADTNAAELTANYLGNSVVVNPQPAMNISLSGNSSTLSWPVWAGDFTLQAAGSLTPPITWSNVPVTLQTNGDHIEITVPTSSQQTFFRLYHP